MSCVMSCVMLWGHVGAGVKDRCQRGAKGTDFLRILRSAAFMGCRDVAHGWHYITPWDFSISWSSGFLWAYSRRAFIKLW